MLMNLFILIPILLPLLAGAALPLVAANDDKKRKTYVVAVMIFNTMLVVMLAVLSSPEIRMMHITDAINIFLRVDDLSRFFMILASAMWLIVTFYAFEYIKPHGKETRFFVFFLMAYGAIIGACLAGNFFTLYLFYELITLLTFPMVIHFGTEASSKAGAKYLMYSFFGAALIMIGFVFMSNYGVTTDFVAGGTLDAGIAAANETALLVVFIISFMCAHHFLHASVCAMAAQRSSHSTSR